MVPYGSGTPNTKVAYLSRLLVLVRRKCWLDHRTDSSIKDLETFHLQYIATADMNLAINLLFI